jgi:hypothetical protein
MTLFARLRRSAPAIAGALLALTACGCGTPAGGDPGDELLKQLAGDRVFTALPDGATEVDTTKQPARYRKPGFSGGGWDGPAVIVTFKSPSPPEEVYRFFARTAEDAGWKPKAAGRLGLTDRWAKTYSDGAAATLSLVLLDQESSPRTYRLSGGVAPATS